MPHLNQSVFKISLIGAAGGIGQSLSLLLKSQLPKPEIYDKVELCLFDINKDVLNGVMVDLSHIDTLYITLKLSQDIHDCLHNSDMIIMLAGLPRRPGMTRDDLFHINGTIINDLALNIMKNNPSGSPLKNISIVSNPVNSLVPLMVETFKLYKREDLISKVYGVTILDQLRCNHFTGNMNQNIVIGGHSGDTIVPVIQDNELSDNEKLEIINKIRFGGDEVVKAKKGHGSATLSMAYAGFKIFKQFYSLFTSIETNEIGITLYHEIDSCAITGNVKPAILQNVRFFSIPMVIGKNGIPISFNFEIFKYLMNNEFYAEKLLPTCIEKITENIETGIEKSKEFYREQ
ncbi:malate dehydrogenase MDH2 SCDLUD_005028 [Saccharomycodes ludwigii]|uniref:malate dehydrogenase MDH2 n=1 Tax=Saccharomycodes ludwigii TaxID=36035 RepID=UPI001E8747F3|nr:hypothetical protein SCDLUD_005028 [Saccharomycodes ludwigii]KAH3898704.1 hypothetical protein SCDLUD_005028 [Saccharomycodes ludwigii]